MSKPNAIDFSKLSYDELLEMEKSIKDFKEKLYNKETFYKSDAIPKEIYDLCADRFSVKKYPNADIHHCIDDGPVTGLALEAKRRFNKAMLTLGDLVLDNYTVKKDNQIVFNGALVTKNAKYYSDFIKELTDLIIKYNQLIFENGKEFNK